MEGGELPTPEEWTSTDNPPYSYWGYYMHANIKALNRLMFLQGMRPLDFRPHCGEAGSVSHLATMFLLAKGINHGILLKKSPVLQYLFYLQQIGLAMSPLSNNALFLEVGAKRQLRRASHLLVVLMLNLLSLAAAAAAAAAIASHRAVLLQLLHVCAAGVWCGRLLQHYWKLSPVDLCELARNSVLQRLAFPDGAPNLAAAEGLVSYQGTTTTATQQQQQQQQQQHEEQPPSEDTSSSSGGHQSVEAAAATEAAAAKALLLQVAREVSEADGQRSSSKPGDDGNFSGTISRLPRLWQQNPRVRLLLQRMQLRAAVAEGSGINYVTTAAAMTACIVAAQIPRPLLSDTARAPQCLWDVTETALAWDHHQQQQQQHLSLQEQAALLLSALGRLPLGDFSGLQR
ncbi:hypothetical protein ACSSS7_002689 [Eimeria intestinalis]